MTVLAEDRLDGTAWMTLVVFAVISVVVYILILQPIYSSDRPAPNGQEGAHRAEATAAQPVPRTAPSAISQLESQEVGLWMMTRRPPHMQATNKTMDILVDGMIPFRNIQASTYEASKDDPDMLGNNRKDRAKLLSKILSLDKAASPPPRGATVVLSIVDKDVSCDKARRVIFLLATYFNLLLVVVVPSKTTDLEMKELVTTLRGSESQIPVEVIADHRIIAVASVTGRVALVRQLARRVEFVLDFDTQVKTELSRFGFRVMLYGNAELMEASNGTSLLGLSLLS